MHIQQLFSILEKTDRVWQGHAEWHGKLDLITLRNMFSYSTEAAGINRWQINLPDKGVITVRTCHIEPTGDMDAIWYGDMQACSEIQVILAVQDLGTENPEVSGYIRSGANNYSLSPVPGGMVSIVYEHSHYMHDCGTEYPSTKNGEFPVYSDEQKGVVSSDITLPAAVSESTAIITVLPVYGPGMTMKYSAGAIKGTCMTAQGYTNKAFANSGIDARTLYLEPVYLEAIKTDKFMEAMGIIGLLGEKGNPADPLYKAVHDARENAQADTVVMLFAEWDGSTRGVASNIPEPPTYDRTGLGNACFAVGTVLPEVFAHELGHLLGGKHDRITMPWVDSLNPAYDYACGYISSFPGDVAPFVTLMGYANSAKLESASSIPRIQAYSAADRYWDGKPLGVPLGKPDAADAAMLFRQSAHVLAAYRGSEEKERFVANQKALDLKVVPDIGGTLMPSLPGPYTTGTIVAVRALPRFGHRFSHWMLEGVPAPSSEPVIWISMNDGRKLTAYFEEVGEQHTVSVRAWLGFPVSRDGPKKALSPSEYTVTLIPEGPFETGSHTAVFVTLKLSEGSTHRHIAWAINQDIIFSSRDFADNRSSLLSLKVERNLMIDCYFIQEN